MTSILSLTLKAMSLDGYCCSQFSFGAAGRGVHGDFVPPHGLLVATAIESETVCGLGALRR